MDGKTYSDILELLHREVKPALGCTEPIAVSLAVAKACSLFRPLKPDCIDVQVSANILKNGMGVGVPGTGMVGLHIAAALAMECGKPEYGLEVLKDLTKEDVERARLYMESGKVKISLADTDKKLYIHATCDFTAADGQTHRAETVIADDHDAIVYVSEDGRVLVDRSSEPEAAEAAKGTGQPEYRSTLDYHLNLRKIYEFATTADMNDIKFILDAADMNKALSKEGLLHKYGLHGSGFGRPHGRLHAPCNEQFRQRQPGYNGNNAGSGSLGAADVLIRGTGTGFDIKSPGSNTH